MSYRKLKAILVPAILLLLLSAASILFINALIQRPSIQNYFLGHLSEFAGYELCTDKIKISFWHGVTLSANNLEAISKTGPEKIVASRIKVTLDAGELIKRRIVPTRVLLVHPQIELSLAKDRPPSEASIESTLKKILVQRFMGLALLSLEDAKVRIEGLPFRMDNLYLDVSRRAGNPRQLHVNLLGGFIFKESKVPFTLRGTIGNDKNTPDDPSAKMTLKARMIPLNWIPWPDFLPVTGGVAEAAIIFNGTLDGHLSAEGKITANDFGLSLVRTRGTKSFDLPRLVFDFSSTFSDNILEIPHLRMITPDFLLTVDSKFDFRDKSNPHLNLNVNSPFMSVQTFKRIFPNPLVASWIENRLFPILTGGNVRVDLFSLKGTFNQIDNLKQPQNATALSLKINWKDLEVFKDSGGLPFEEVSGKLDIENGALTVSNVKGKFGVSTIREGALHIKNLYGHDIKYNILIDGLFDFEDLSRQRAIELIPLDVRHELHKYEDPTGNLEARVNLRFEKGWNYPKIQKGEFLLKECMFVHKALFFPLELEEVQIKINEKGTASFIGTGAWGNSTFKTGGSLENSLQTGSAWIEAQGDVNQMINQFYHGKLLPLKFTERTTLKFSLFRLYDLWSCQGEIDLEGIEVETLSFSMNPPGEKDKIIFSLDLQPRKRVDLRNFICLLGNSIVELSGSYNLKDRDSFVVQASTPGLDMEDLGMRLKDKETENRAKGQILCEADVSGSFMDPLKTHVNGEVEARDLSFVSGALPSPISDCSFKIILSEKTVSILSLKMRVGESPIVVHGNLGGWDGLKGRLTVDSDYLNISDLITKDTGSRLTYKDSAPNRFTRESSIHFKLKALKGRWKEISCGPLEAECTFQSGDLLISYSKFQMEHGDLNMKGHLKGGREPEKLFSIYVNLTDQPVKELLYSIGLEKVDLEGRLTSEAVLFTRGKDNKEMISGLTGSGNILIEDGQVRKSMVILQVLDFLSLQKIFKKRPPDLSKEGFYFENIKGHFAVNHGIINTENLTMRSPVLNAIAKGSTDLNTKLVDYDLGAHPLGTIDSLVSKIPVAGYILTGKEKAILVYYFKVSGVLEKPEVKYVPLKNLGNSVFGFFKRLFFTPGRIFEKISKAGQEPEEDPHPAKE